MTTLEISVPDHLEFSLGLRTRQELSDEARILLAVKLFELERLSSGRAAELAGMDRETFLLTLPRYGVPAVNWSEEEIQAEGMVREPLSEQMGYGAVMTERDMRVAACVKWYELGRLSQGRAAELAELSRAEFIEELGHYGVSVFQVGAEELAEEMGG